jgi:Rrf2 family protein
LALIALSENYNNGVLKIQEIAKRKSIPRKYLEQILITLKGNGYVKSRQGYMGGYMLAKAPEEISLAEILRLIDGALAPVESASKLFYGESPIEQSDTLVKIFKDIRNYMADKLENTTFADLVQK